MSSVRERIERKAKSQNLQLLYEWKLGALIPCDEHEAALVAARDAALEEAAEISDGMIDYGVCGRQIATAIRAAKGGE